MLTTVERTVFLLRTEQRVFAYEIKTDLHHSKTNFLFPAVDRGSTVDSGGDMARLIKMERTFMKVLRKLRIPRVSDSTSFWIVAFGSRSIFYYDHSYQRHIFSAFYLMADILCGSFGHVLLCALFLNLKTRWYATRRLYLCK